MLRAGAARGRSRSPIPVLRRRLTGGVPDRKQYHPGSLDSHHSTALPQREYRRSCVLLQGYAVTTPPRIPGCLLCFGGFLIWSCRSVPHTLKHTAWYTRLPRWSNIHAHLYRSHIASRLSTSPRNSALPRYIDRGWGSLMQAMIPLVAETRYEGVAKV